MNHNPNPPNCATTVNQTMRPLTWRRTCRAKTSSRREEPSKTSRRRWEWGCFYAFCGIKLISILFFQLCSLFQLTSPCLTGLTKPRVTAMRNKVSVAWNTKAVSKHNKLQRQVEQNQTKNTQNTSHQIGHVNRQKASPVILSRRMGRNHNYNVIRLKLSSTAEWQIKRRKAKQGSDLLLRSRRMAK